MMQAPQYYAAGGCPNGFHPHPAAAPAVTPPEELTRLAEDFCSRYPVDANAMDYLLTSSPEVQARVVQEFRPPQEGQGDYSALLTAFVKRCRGDARAAGSPALAAPLVPQQLQPQLPPQPGGTIVGAGGQLLTLSPSGVYEAVRAPEAIDPLGMVGVGYSGRQEPFQASTTMPGGLPSVSLDAFLARYPVDERACDYFSCQRPEVQEKVLREFRPPREGEADYSSLFMSFVKRCRAPPVFGAALGGPGPTVAPLPSAAPRPLVFATPSALLRGGPLQAPSSATGVAAAPSGPGSNPGLDALAARYPIDDRAYDYFSTCPPDVQERVLREFRPPREGEADYSSLFMAFVKRCRQGARQELYHPPFTPTPQMQPAHSGGWSSGGGLGGTGAILSAGPEGLESFRLRFPIDERAMAYLAESSEEVRERVLNTFVPPRPDDVDFSAPVTAYVRECRRLLDPGAGGFAAQQPLQQQQQQADGSGFADPAVGYVDPGSTAPAGFAEAAGLPDASADELNNFMQRYPIDARALDYLSTSSPGVVSRVVREFSPKQEGDSDYSALVMAFTKRCRGEERAGAGSYFEPPWKRARAF
mmetsp:Transcript_111891/g.311442  ORF Transcript_111891/g.311442 Transcript_111891/m.311442 type:complete len:587 (-) Transcript_111891:104-1864(-)